MRGDPWEDLAIAVGCDFCFGSLGKLLSFFHVRCISACATCATFCVLLETVLPKRSSPTEK